MTPSIRALIEALYAGNDEPGGYLANPSQRPEVNQGRPPLPMPTAPAWRAQMGALPRVAQQQDNRIVMGPGGMMDAPPPMRVAPPSSRGTPLDSPAGYSDAASYLRDAMPPAQTPSFLRAPQAPQGPAWTQPEQMGANAAVSENRLPIGAPALNRGLEPPSAPQEQQSAYLGDDDAEWNAARDRVRAQMRTETRAAGARIPRPGAPLIAQAFNSRAR